MKKTISILLPIFLLCTINLTSCGAEPLSKSEVTTVIMQIDNPVMTVNGAETEIDNEGTVPIVRNGRTLVPVRAVIEAFGGIAEWNDDTQGVTLTLGNDTIKLTINSDIAYINNTVRSLDVAPVILSGRTMLPIRFVAEGFGLDVDWRESDSVITVTKPAQKLGQTPAPAQKESSQESDNSMIALTITVNGMQYSAKLYDNETTREWIKQLPAEYDMSELNGNEKYYYLSDNLPSKSSRPDMINTGDIMLYGSNCVVLFYKTFSTSYSYTKLGYIENPDGLENAVGSDNANVRFEIQ